MSCVLDASTSVAWLHPWEATPALAQFFRDIAINGAWVPALWHLEIANVLRTNLLRKRYSEATRDHYLLLMRQVPVVVDAFTDQRAWTGTLALSDLHKLTLYDAAYLELAIRRNLPLATLDGDLRTAANREGVPLVAL